MEDLIKLLQTSDSPSEVMPRLQALKKSNLILLADHFKVYKGSKTKAQLAEAIVEGTIGAKLRSAVIRNILGVNRA